MAGKDAYDSKSGEEEHIITLPNNRQLAYAHNGPVTSRTVIIFFPDLFCVGSAPRVSETCRKLEAHLIALSPQEWEILAPGTNQCLTTSHSPKT